MAEHLANGDRPIALVIQAKVGQIMNQWRVEIDFTFLHQLHDGCGDERLGH